MNTRDIKGRIKSVTNIKQITEAMKLVAAARLRKAEEKAKGARPYAEKIEELIRRASSAAPDFTSPLFRQSEVKKTGYLIISSDKGLAGAYNSNVMKKTISEISGKDPSAYALSICGKQARNYLKFRGYTFDAYRFGFSDKPTSLEAREVAKEITEWFLKEEVDEVYIIYTKFYTALRQEVTMSKLLPIEAPEAEEAEGELTQDYMFLPMQLTYSPSCFPNISKCRSTAPCSSPQPPNSEAVWQPCPLRPTMRQSASTTSTCRTTKHVRHRSPTKSPKSSAARTHSNDLHRDLSLEKSRVS